MKTDYSDIIEKLGPPLWYDGNTAPRYVAFHPDRCGVYNDFVALVRVCCQSCGKEFIVAREIDKMDRLRYADYEPVLPGPEGKGDPWDKVGSFHWGDAPRHNCSGDTMNSVPLEVLEFWQSNKQSWTWERVPDCEGVILNSFEEYMDEYAREYILEESCTPDL